MDGGYPAEIIDDYRCKLCGALFSVRHVMDGGPGAAYVPVSADCPRCGYNTWTAGPELVGPPEPLGKWWQRAMDRALLRALTTLLFLFATAAYAGPDIYTIGPGSTDSTAAVQHSKDGKFDPPVLIQQFPAQPVGRIAPLPGAVNTDDSDDDSDGDEE